MSSSRTLHLQVEPLDPLRYRDPLDREPLDLVEVALPPRKCAEQVEGVEPANLVGRVDEVERANGELAGADVVRLDVERNLRERDQSAPFDATVTRSVRRFADLAHLGRDGREVRQPPGCARRQVAALERPVELRGPDEQPPGDSIRLAGERPPAGLLERGGRFCGELRGDMALELFLELNRVLQVVGPNLDELVACRAFREPARHLEVERRPGRLREAGVGDVADQDVLEAIRVLATDRRPRLAYQEVALDEVLQGVRHGRRLGEGRDRPRPERPAGDSGTPQHRALGGGQAIDAGRDHRLHRVRDPRELAVRLEEHAHGLLDEEWIALGCREQCLTLLVRELGRLAFDERVDEARAVGCGERLELDRRRAHVAAAPRRPLVEQVVAGEAENQERDVLDAARQVLDQVEHRLLGEMDVLEHEHERLQVGEPRGPGLCRPGDLRCRPLAAADGIEHARCEAEQVCHRLVAAGATELLGRRVDGVGIGDPGGNLHHLRDGPVGDALPVRQAAAREDRRALDAVHELARETRLPHSGGAEDRDEMDAIVPHRPRERVVKQVDLLLAADERHRDDQAAPDLLRDRDDTPCLDTLGEALRLLRAERRRHDEPARKPLDGGTEQDVTRLRGLLQARGGVDREPGRECRLRLVREDLARLDADAHLEAELAHRLDDSERGAHRRSGSSSCANGTPNADITASPANFWTIPPCAVMQWETSSKNRVMRERTTSGSALATSCVEPTRSTKRTVASLRSIPKG